MKNYFDKRHLIKLYKPLYESVLNYGIIHWGGSHHLSPIKVLQNRVCRTILGMNRRTSEKEIYVQMEVHKVEELFKYRLLLFVFSNKELFQICDTIAYTRTGGGPVAKFPKFVKHHSRIQARYQGTSLYNKLFNHARKAKKIADFKRLILQVL